MRDHAGVTDYDGGWCQLFPCMKAALILSVLQLGMGCVSVCLAGWPKVVSIYIGIMVIAKTLTS